MGGSLNLFWSPRVVVALPCVVVRRRNLPGFETVFEIFVHAWVSTSRNDRCHFSIEKSRLTFPKLSKCAKTPKMHIFVQIYNFFKFSLFTVKHKLNVTINLSEQLIQMIQKCFQHIKYVLIRHPYALSMSSLASPLHLW